MNIVHKLYEGTRLAIRRTTHRLRKQVPDLPTLQDVTTVHTLDVPARVEDRDGATMSLAVYEIASEDWDLHAPNALTIVFAHGFTLSAQSWFFQVERLRQLPNIRLLIPDLRGHGNSPAQPEILGMDGTASDLVEAVRQLASDTKEGEPGDRQPNGKLMLIGHSMGVMTVLGALRLMSDAERERVAGIAMINGAIDRFASAGITQVLDLWIVRKLRALGKRFPGKAERLKDAMEWVLEPFIASFVYHGALEEGASSRFDIVEYHAEEIDHTTITTVLGYLDDLVNHDETPAAPLLAGIPGVVMVGARDNVTPASQTRELADIWDDATLREFPDAGHMLLVECPEAVNREIVELVEKVRPACGPRASRARG